MSPILTPLQPPVFSKDMIYESREIMNLCLMTLLSNTRQAQMRSARLRTVRIFIF